MDRYLQRSSEPGAVATDASRRPFKGIGSKIYVNLGVLRRDVDDEDQDRGSYSGLDGV